MFFGHQDAKFARSLVLGSYLRERVNFGRMTSKRVNPQGIPPHRQRHLSRFGNVHHPCTRASPQCHELPLQPTHAVVLKFLHELYVLVAAGTDSRVHLLRILAQYCAHGGADRPRRVNLK